MLTAQDPPPKFEFIGINVFQETATDVPPVHSIREYHWWESEQGDLEDGNPPYPDNIYKFSPSYRGNDFDDYYNTLIGNGHTTILPSFTRTVPYLYDDSNPNTEDCAMGLPIYPPMPGDPNGERPESYFAHADYMFHYAARYGNTTLDDAILNARVAADQQVSALGFVNFMEDRNEPDLENFCEGTGTYTFSPAQYAAFSSANYDGHGGNMIYSEVINDIEIKYSVGIKNADPAMQMVLGGLSDFDYTYLGELKIEWEEIRQGMNPVYPTDVFNFHHYSDKNNAGFNFAGHGFSPEEDIVEGRNLRQQMEDMVNHVQTEFGSQYACWLTEFGYDTNPFSYQAAIPDYTFDPPIDTPDGSVSNFRASLLNKIVPNWSALSEANRSLLMGIMYETQGQWMVRSLLEGSASGFEKMFIYQDRDVQATPQCFEGECERSSTGQTFEFSGIYESEEEGLTPKTSYYYVSTMSQVLAGLNFSEDLSPCRTEEETNPAFIINSEVDCPKMYKYIDGDGSDDIEGVTTYAFWSPTSTNKVAYNYEIIDLPEDITATIVTMVDGDEDGSFEIVEVSSDGKLVVQVTERPKFLILDEIETCQTPELAITSINPQDCQTVQLTWNTPPSPGCDYDHFELYYGRDVDIPNPAAPLLSQLTLFDDDIPISFDEGIFTKLDPNTCYWFYIRSVSISGEASELSGAAAATLPAEDLCWIDILNEPGITIDVDNPNQVADGFFQYGIGQGDCIGCDYFNAENYDPIGWNYFASGNGDTGGSFIINFPNPYDIHAIHFFDDESAGFMEVSFLIGGVWSDPASIETVDFEEWGQLSNFEINGNGATAIQVNFTTPEARIAKLVICGEPIGGDLAGCFSDDYNTCNADADFNLSACDLTVEGAGNMAGIWEMGDGTTYTDVDNVTHTYTNSGTYEITFTTENPCASTCGQELTLPDNSAPDASFSFEDPGCNPVVNFSVSEPLWNHTWDFAGQGTSDEVNPTHNFGQPGDYIVTHTVTIGDCASVTETITVVIETCTPNLNCAPVTGEVYVYSGVTLISEIVANPEIGFITSPGVGRIFLEENERIEIEGTLIVDMTVGIIGGNWFMYPGSEIRVNPALQVVTENVTFSGCDGMWKGIHFINNNQYACKNGTTIADALIGISMNNPNKANIGFVEFDRNFIGVYLQGNTNSVRIARNNFTCSQNLLPNTTEFAEGVPASLFPTPGNRSYAGIFSRHSGALTIGAPSNFSNIHINTFDGLANGIISTNADALIVRKVALRNITRGDYGGTYDGDPAFSGYGIHAVDAGEVTLEGRLTDPVNPVGEPEMDNVVDGVFAESVNMINIKNSWMTNVARGVNTEINPNAEIAIIGNSISSSTIGVNVNNCPAIDLEVSSNVFFSGDPTSSEYNISAITIESVLGSTSSIRDNEITLNVVSDGVLHSGIYINDSDNIEAVENNITMVNPTQASYTKSYGFRIDEGSGHIFSCNQIAGSDRELKRWGFKVDNSSGSKYACNYLQDTKNGMQFYGNCSNSELTTNEFNRHKIALELATADTEIGEQSNGGNTWSGEEEVGARFVPNSQNDLTDSRFEITTPNNCPNDNLWPCNIEVGGLSSTDWFNFGPGNPAPTCNFEAECGITPLSIAPVNPCNPNSLAIINNEVSSLEYPVGVPWLSDRGLYTNLVESNTLPANCNQVYQNYQNEISITNLGKLVNVERQTKNSYHIDEFTREYLDNNTSEIQELKNKIEMYHELLSQATNSRDSTSLEAEQLYFINKLGEKSAFYRAVIKELNSSRLIKQASIQQLNQQISSTFAYEKNEQVINEIYLETVFAGIRNITTDQHNMIKEIAELCPNEGGPDVVFQARGLAALFKIKFNPMECKSTGKKSAKERNGANQEKEKEKYFIVSPNPTRENITANYQFSDKQERYWELFDATGKLIYSKNTNDEKGILNIPLTIFSNGLFFLTIRENGVIIQSEKIIKQ